MPYSIRHTPSNTYYVWGGQTARTLRYATKYYTAEDAERVILFRALPDSEVIQNPEQIQFPARQEDGQMQDRFGNRWQP